MKANNNNWSINRAHPWFYRVSACMIQLPRCWRRGRVSPPESCSGADSWRWGSCGSRRSNRRPCRHVCRVPKCRRGRCCSGGRDRGRHRCRRSCYCLGGVESDHRSAVSSPRCSCLVSWQWCRSGAHNKMSPIAKVRGDKQQWAHRWLRRRCGLGKWVSVDKGGKVCKCFLQLFVSNFKIFINIYR